MRTPRRSSYRVGRCGQNGIGTGVRSGTASASRFRDRRLVLGVRLLALTRGSTILRGRGRTRRRVPASGPADQLERAPGTLERRRVRDRREMSARTANSYNSRPASAISQGANGTLARQSYGSSSVTPVSRSQQVREFAGVVDLVEIVRADRFDQGGAASSGRRPPGRRQDRPETATRHLPHLLVRPSAARTLVDLDLAGLRVDLRFRHRLCRSRVGDRDRRLLHLR